MFINTLCRRRWQVFIEIFSIRKFKKITNSQRDCSELELRFRLGLKGADTTAVAGCCCCCTVRHSYCPGLTNRKAPRHLWESCRGAGEEDHADSTAGAREIHCAALSGP